MAQLLHPERKRVLGKTSVSNESFDGEAMAEHLSKVEQVRLAEEARQGSREAFNQIHTHFHQALLGNIRGWIRNQQDAEDLAQESWEYCWKKIDTYNPKFAFYTFLINFSRILIMRYFERSKQWKKLFVLLSEFPELQEKTETSIFGPPHAPRPQRDSVGIPPEAEPVFMELLCLTFNCCAKPHQLITFGFNKLLEWKPREIVDELSHKTLGDLSEKLYRNYVSGFDGFDNDIADCFSSLFFKLEENLKDVCSESEYEALRAQIPTAIVGLTKLEDYLGKDPAHSISDWSNKIKKRVGKILTGQKSVCQVKKRADEKLEDVKRWI